VSFSQAFSRRCSQSLFRYENNSNFHIINDFVVGSYQVKQAIPYTEEQLSPSPHYEDELKFIVELISHDDDLVRRHFSSRHSNNKNHIVIIQYHCKNTEQPINYSYCICTAGRRDVSCCAHAAALLRHLEQCTTIR